ncbi:hypothetical protein GCM10009609_20750 [Pseudonocardia aurantiaca]
MVITVLLGASVAYGGFGFVHSDRTCGDGFTWLGIEATASDVVRIDGICVGVTDGSNPLVLPDGRIFDQVRTTILDHNRQALELHRLQPDRPLVTLVFLGSLTAPPGAPPDTLTAEREQLAGAAVVQAVQLAKAPQRYGPLGSERRGQRRVCGARRRPDPAVVPVRLVSPSPAARELASPRWRSRSVPQGPLCWRAAGRRGWANRRRPSSGTAPRSCTAPPPCWPARSAGRSSW